MQSRSVVQFKPFIIERRTEDDYPNTSRELLPGVRSTMKKVIGYSIP